MEAYLEANVTINWCRLTSGILQLFFPSASAGYSFTISILLLGIHLELFKWMWNCQGFEAFQETPAQTDNRHACCSPPSFYPYYFAGQLGCFLFFPSDPIAASVSSLWEWSGNFSHPLKKTWFGDKASASSFLWKHLRGPSMVFCHSL